MRRLLVVLCLALATPQAFAQGTPNTVELTPTVGYWFGDTISRGAINTIPFDVTVDDAPSYGLRIGYRFTPNWAFEGFLARGRADLVTGNRELFGGQSRIGRMDMTTAEANMEVSFGHSRLVPFLAGGIGAMRLEPTLDASTGGSLSSDTRLVGDFGGGLKLFFTPQVALRFDWRGHSVNIDNRHDCGWWDDCSNDRNWLTFTEVGLGLTFVL